MSWLRFRRHKVSTTPPPDLEGAYMAFWAALHQAQVEADQARALKDER